MIKLLLLLSSLFNLFLWFSHDDISYAISFAPLISILLSVFSIIHFRDRCLIFRLIYLLFVGILIFNTSWYFTFLFNQQKVYIILFEKGITYSAFMKSNFLLGISLPLISLGYLVNNSNITFQRNKYENVPLFVLLLATVIFLGLSLYDSGLTIGALYVGEGSVWYMLLVRFMMLSACAFAYTYTISNNNYSLVNLLLKNKFFPIISLLFIFYVLIGGDRGPVLTLLLIVGSSWLLMNKGKIRKTNVAVIFVSVLIVTSTFQLISVLRGSEFGAAFKFDNIGAYANLEEDDYMLGSSQLCTYLAIQGIESGRISHSLGLYFITALIQSIPYLGRKLVQSVGLEFFSGGSAQLITEYYYGKFPTSGLGTTYLADIYIEFGLIGVVIISFIFGYFVKHIENLAQSRSLLSFPKFCFVMFFVGYSVYTGRATIYTFLIYYIHAMFFYYIVAFLYKHIRR